MTVTIGVAFFGRFRPAYFEGADIYDAAEKFLDAIRETDRDTRNKLCGWLIAAEETFVRSPNTHSTRVDHGPLALSVVRDGYDGFLERATDLLAAFPGLDYSKAARKAA